MPDTPVVDIRNSFGAIFIGQLVCTALFGLTVVQTWTYYRNYGKRDSKPLKYFIAFITVMDAIHIFLCSYVIYWYLVLNFGNVENMKFTMWAMDSQAHVALVVNASVQLYYAKRVYKVSRSLICPIIIVALVVVVFALGVYFTVRGTILSRFSSLHSLTWVLITGLTSSVVADLLIAASMCWYLYRKKTGFARTDSIITTLMAYCVNSGLVTTVLAGTMTITFLVSPSSLIWVTFNWVLCKCYVNSLLAMLNSRDNLRDRPPASWSNPDNGVNMSSFRIEPLSSAYGSKSGSAGVSVHVHRSTTSNFTRNKSDHGHDVKPAFEVPKPDASIGPLTRTSESSA